jgi:hypothetical protein
MGKGKKKAKKAKQTKLARQLKHAQAPGGRRGVREAVPADLSGFFDDGDGPDSDGSAGVREPRNPKPLPLSSAGARPMPHPEFAFSVRDPRY